MDSKKLMSVLTSTKLNIFNCNQNTEASDFIGEQRPVRNKSQILKNLKEKISIFLNRFPQYNVGAENCAENSKNIMKNIEYLLNDKNKFSAIFEAECHTDSEECILTKKEIKDLFEKSHVLFEWNDGVLLKSMKNGEIILFDEVLLYFRKNNQIYLSN